mgnify:CR=1 FL=1
MTMRRLQQIITGESALAELLQRRQRAVALEQRIEKTLPDRWAVRRSGRRLLLLEFDATRRPACSAAAAPLASARA